MKVTCFNDLHLSLTLWLKNRLFLWDPQTVQVFASSQSQSCLWFPEDWNGKHWNRWCAMIMLSFFPFIPSTKNLQLLFYLAITIFTCCSLQREVIWGVHQKAKKHIFLYRLYLYLNQIQKGWFFSSSFDFSAFVSKAMEQCWHLTLTSEPFTCLISQMFPMCGNFLLKLKKTQYILNLRVITNEIFCFCYSLQAILSKTKL